MDKLTILWTTDNMDTIKGFLQMYTENSISKGWWEEINVVIWGASAKFIGENKEAQEVVRSMLDCGVTVEACKSCAKRYDVLEILSNIEGLDVKYMGAPLTEYLKSDGKFLSV